MAKKAKEAAPAAATEKDQEKLAKRKVRMEAIKNRPAVQRPNGKQIDVVESEAGTVKNFGYPVKEKNQHVGVLVTSVAYDKAGNVISTSVTFVPGNLTVKSKKGHGVICAPKAKGEKDIDDNTEVEEADED
jgi:hypothetical protein